MSKFDLGFKILPLQDTSPQDLSSTWKTLGAVRAVKVARRPYYLYLALSSKLANFKPEDEKCSQCKDDNTDECACHEVTDNKHADKINNYLLNFMKQNQN